MPTDAPRGESPDRAVVREFAALERRLTALARLLRRGPAGRIILRAGAVDATGAALEALLLERLADLRRVLARLRQFEGQWAAATVPRQWARSAGAAQTTLRRAGRLVTPRFQGFEARAVQALTERVASNMGTIREGLEQGLVLADPRLAVERIRQGAIEAAGVRLDGDVVRIVTPSGRFWRPEPYARMVARTGVADARRVSFRHRYLANGVDVVRVVANGTTHPTCAVWEGRQLSLTGATPGLPTVAEARAAGLFHPNCTHRYVVDPDADQPGVEATAGAALAEPAPSRAVQAFSTRDPRIPNPSVRVPRGTRIPGTRLS